MSDPYLYENSEVLINLLGIKNEKALKDAEADYVSLQLKLLVKKPLPGEYDIDHLYAMHKYLFQDIYEWAGMQRKINIEKEEEALGGLSVEYSDVFDIPKDITSVLTRMTGRDWKRLNHQEVADAVCEDMAALWKIHPFREGNTRTCVTFICQYCDDMGFPINRELLAENSAYVRTALVAYNAVFHDMGDLSKKEYLQRIIEDALFGNKWKSSAWAGSKVHITYDITHDNREIIHDKNQITYDDTQDKPLILKRKLKNTQDSTQVDTQDED